MRRCWTGEALLPVKDDLRDACKKLTSFVDPDFGHLFFRGTDISTTKGGITDEEGALIELPSLPIHGCYHANHLNKVLEASDMIDLARYPEAIPFSGGSLRGIMLGIKA